MDNNPLYRYINQVNKVNRDQYGLLLSVEYPFKEDGKIDWAKLIEPQYFVPNVRYFEDRGQPVPKSAKGLSDNQKVVLLMGYKKLSNLRGFSSLKYIPIGYSGDEVVVSCEIDWLPNFETGMKPITYSSIGNASLRNVTDDTFSKFLGPLAENRAFIKNVRSFLSIPIYGFDEFAKKDDKRDEATQLPSNISPTSPHAVLIKRMQERGMTFEQLKERLSESNLSPVSPDIMSLWSSEIDIPTSDTINIISWLLKLK
jgi:hypothetical protein